MKEIVIRDICGDYALDLPLDNASTFTLYFNSYQNALNVKRIIEVDRSVPNAATVCDMQEVVRCKDCQYAKPYERNDGKTGYYCQHQNCTFLYGTNWERLFEPIKEANDFCSYGVAKMDGKGEVENG